MKILRRINVNTKEEKLKIITLFNNIIFKHRSKKLKLQINKDEPVFYLKVNRNIEDTFICLQYWINIISDINADFYIVCDNKDLKLKILEKIQFKNSNIKFIKSKIKPFKKIVKKQKLHKKWERAAFAHLSVFLHAKENNIQNFWNIDADDALLLTEVKNAVNIIKQAEIYADNKGLNAFSFDFWATKTKGRHWSFGITYIRNNVDYFDAINKNIINWEDYKNFTSVHNIDWIFSSLKDKSILNLESFYVENLYFLHWGRFFGDMKNSYISVWNNGEMFYPIWNIFKDKRCIHKIPENIVKFDFGIQQEDCLNFSMEYLVNLKRLPIIEKEFVYK